MSEELPTKLKEFLKKLKKQAYNYVYCFYENLSSNERDYETIKQSISEGFRYSIKGLEAELDMLGSLEDEFDEIIYEIDEEQETEKSEEEYKYSQ